MNAPLASLVRAEAAVRAARVAVAAAAEPRGYAPGTLAELARAAGISRTRHRSAIINVLEAAFILGETLRPDEILERARQIEPALTSGAVQRSLTAFRRAGLIVKTAFPKRGYRIAAQSDRGEVSA